MAGMPKSLLVRAEEILQSLEKKQVASIQLGKEGEELPGMQLSIFDAHSEVFSDIRKTLENVDVNKLTPIEALVILNEIKKTIN
jgi:DNA mismatch repair protein MutS